MTPQEKLKEIKECLDSRPGEANFDPCNYFYKYKKPYENTKWLIARVEQLEGALTVNLENNIWLRKNEIMHDRAVNGVEGVIKITKKALNSGPKPVEELR